MPRRPRGTRRSPASALLLQPRDEDVLLPFIGRSGVCALPHVARIGWNGPGALPAAARRVRQYADHGLVDVTVTALNRPNRLTLTPLGAERIGRVNDTRTFRTRVSATSAAAEHLVASADVWSCIEARLRDSPRVRLARFLTEGEMRRALRERRDALIPDGLAILEPRATAHGGRSGGPHRAQVVIAVEVDLATELAPVFARKAARYRAHLAEGALLHGLRVDALLVVAPGQRRLAQLARAVANIGDATFLQDLGRLTPRTVLDELATIDTLARSASGASPFTVSLLGDTA